MTFNRLTGRFAGQLQMTIGATTRQVLVPGPAARGMDVALFRLRRESRGSRPASPAEPRAW
ncbi:hypothetical protein [Nonomuraea sp. NPDC049709]|uniref:hypothetical protein n=1 Tax=Nonomuraea sp. NPDC049709 TaxID=3154736 RepID=UPI003412CABD